MEYKPPFTVSEKILSLLADISELIGGIRVTERTGINPRLRKANRIRTIHSSLAIENNSLSLEQVTAIIDGKRVLGAPSEILEVKNAFEAYEHMLEFNPYSVDDLLKAHGIMMSALVHESGRFRTGGVGVFAGEKLVHMAPPADMVYGQITDLLDWVKNSQLHMLVKSCVFHYEFEFIHPFADGNGRMGRMWHTLLLSEYQPLFVYLPIETLIKERQREYYAALAQSDARADACAFTEFLLQVIYDALNEISDQTALPEKVKKLMEVIGYEPMSAKELMSRLGITRNQTFRQSYLKPAIDSGLIAMTEPNSPNSPTQKYYKK